MASPMKIDVQIVQAFVDGDIGGNPAGVVVDADDLSQQQKQLIAAKAGLSETAFVSASDLADFKLEFFTPNRQIADCGHATVATFGYLEHLQRISNRNTSKEVIDGRREITLEGDMVYMQQAAPRYFQYQESATEILNTLSLNAADLLADQVPTIINTGVSYLLIPLKDEATVARIQPDFTAIEALSEKYDLIGYYAFSLDTKTPGRDAGARMFAPRYGISEEAATGMAAGPLACYLHDVLGISKATLLIEQGQFMSPASPSLIQVDIDANKNGVSSLTAGGHAKLTASLQVEI